MNSILLRSFVAVAIAGMLPGQIPECDAVQTTASGLQWCVLRAGAEEAGPTADDMVEVHYTGWLTDGTKFDSSRDRGQPAQFPLGRVIKGWTEGLQLMTTGARFKLTIPPELGYGSQDNGRIPPNSTLVFDVELLKVHRAPQYVAEDAEKQKDLPSGAKYQVVEEGAGPTAEANEAVAFTYAVFDTDGKLMDCSAWQNGRKISGTSSNLPFPFLKDLVAVMKQGDVVRVRVPAGVVSNFKGDSVWLLKLDGVHRLPKFRLLDPEKTATTQSGLKYEVIQQGDGKRPKASDTVSAMYTGWLTDGTMFDSAHARGMAADFPLSGVIKGWTEGLQLMNVGGSFLFEIPAELGYGVRGSPPKIGPNATLIFLVELVDVK